MKLCVPVVDKNGLASKVSDHFGSAPFFLIVDIESTNLNFITNNNQHRSHGMCQPMSLLADREFDSIIVGAIGIGALNKLKASGKSVLRTDAFDINGVIEACKKGNLVEITEKNACSSHKCN